jgi:UDP-3-O-[3-hydroxymyristoyl] N-acetylglucosamine deacetylase
LDRIAFHGRGLHTGRRSAITLIRAAGPVCFAVGSDQVSREQLRVERAEYGVRVVGAGGRLDVDLVEHLFAALAGLGVQSGMVVQVEGHEVPLLDGGSRELAAAVRALGPPRSAPYLRVAQAGEVLVGESRYSFEPGSTVELAVEIEFDCPTIGVQRATWDGTPERFLAELAPARTFGFRSQYEKLRELGRARCVDPRAVIVLDELGNVVPPGAPPTAGEFARHKLLDLLGDLYLFGGPPLGRITVRRPGHRANHQAVQQALEYGLLERSTSVENDSRAS